MSHPYTTQFKLTHLHTYSMYITANLEFGFGIGCGVIDRLSPCYGSDQSVAQFYSRDMFGLCICLLNPTWKIAVLLFNNTYPLPTIAALNLFWHVYPLAVHFWKFLRLCSYLIFTKTGWYKSTILIVSNYSYLNS